MSATKFWGGEPFAGLGFEWDPQWVLSERQKELQRNVVVIPMTSVANQILGWFKKPVKNWEDLKGRKCRETGITAATRRCTGVSTCS